MRNARRSVPGSKPAPNKGSTMYIDINKQQLASWIDAHFGEEVEFLQQVLRVPTDTPPGNNAPHAELVAGLLEAYGWQAEKHAVPAQQVRDYGMQSITNLIVRRPYAAGGPTVALNAHGDVGRRATTGLFRRMAA